MFLCNFSTLNNCLLHNWNFVTSLIPGRMKYVSNTSHTLFLLLYADFILFSLSVTQGCLSSPKIPRLTPLIKSRISNSYQQFFPKPNASNPFQCNHYLHYLRYVLFVIIDSYRHFQALYIEIQLGTTDETTALVYWEIGIFVI